MGAIFPSCSSPSECLDVNQRQLCIVQGYTRRECESLADVITAIIATYYRLRFDTFDVDKHRVDIRLINSKTMLKYDPQFGCLDAVRPTGQYSTVLLGNWVNSAMCDRCVIDIRYYSLFSKLKIAPFTGEIVWGYVTCNYNHYNHFNVMNLMNWKHALGQQDNKQLHSVGLWTNRGESMYLLNKHTDGKLLKYPIKRIKKNDVLSITFDFMKDYFSVSHKNQSKKINKISLNGVKCLVAGVSLSHSHDGMEIINVNFY